MPVRKTSQIGEGVIRTRARSVVDASALRVQKTIIDLVDSMHHHSLVGMAAPQIGMSLRIFVAHPRNTAFRKQTEKSSLQVCINPRIIKKSKSRITEYEGCGSVAHATLFGLVPRYRSITVSALDQNGKKFLVKASGLLARIVQHEMDHLDGVVFLDRMKNTRSLLDKKSYLKNKKS